MLQRGGVQLKKKERTGGSNGKKLPQLKMSQLHRPEQMLQNVLFFGLCPKLI